MRTRPLTLALLAQIALTAGASAQVFLDDPPVSPTHPTADQPVVARLQSMACHEVPIAVERVGTTITLRHDEATCPITPPIVRQSVDLGLLPAGTYTLRVVDVSALYSEPFVEDEAVFVVAPPPCTGGGLCLLGGRFAITAEWTTADGHHGSGHPLPMSDVSGAFWFFGAENAELVVKVLEACTFNTRRWVYAAGLTDVQVTLRVTDEATGATRTYNNPQGRPFQPIVDSDAFDCLDLPHS
jgi:hypothetical protein